MNLDIAFAESPSWDQNIFETFKWLRENDPVHWSERDQLWIITKYADVVEISKNQELFTSGKGVRPDVSLKIGLIDEPEPHHGQLRKLLNKGFTPRMVAKLEEAFQKLVDDVLDEVAEKGQCDFVDDIAVPLPLYVIAEMIGVRPEDRDRFHRWSDAMMRAEGNEDDMEIVAAAGEAFVEYSAYVTEVIEDRRRSPRNDLVSILVGADESGSLQNFDRTTTAGSRDASEEVLSLHNSELIMLLVVLLVAGNETTRNAMSGAMQALIDHPAERQKLIDDPSKIGAAVEEMLRYVSPVQSFSRTITRDTEFRGHQFKEGQRVLMVYPSANRDADQFPEPDAFKVERNPEHVAFGVGPHFCLGASLARMEMRVTFTELLRRFPDMNYAGDARAEIRPHALVRSCIHMPVSFTPGPRVRKS